MPAGFHGTTSVVNAATSVALTIAATIVDSCARIRGRSQRMIDRKRLPRPGFRRRPRPRRRRPEPVGCRQAERQQTDRAEIEASRRDVCLADAGLMTAEADPQPAVRVECFWRLE